MEIVITKTFDKQLKLVPKYIRESAIGVLEALEEAKNKRNKRFEKIDWIQKLISHTNRRL